MEVFILDYSLDFLTVKAGVRIFSFLFAAENVAAESEM